MIIDILLLFLIFFIGIFGARKALIPSLLNNPRGLLIDVTKHRDEILATHVTDLAMILQPIIRHC